ncbi:MAG: hypothetical protein KF764_00475 [Labilithrix sp.]|nr:hypothetical protein [Labilithrix sp.]
MLRVLRARLFLLSSVAAMAAVSLVTACVGDDPTPSSGAPDANADGSSPDTGDSGGTGGEGDGGGDPNENKDAGIDARPKRDANGPGAAGEECAFNRDCQLALRCECDENTGCACQPGTRGTGKNGIDTCVSGNECASSLCVDGPDQGESICSDECTDTNDCTGKLPRCISVSGIPESICVREPPK